MLQRLRVLFFGSCRVSCPSLAALKERTYIDLHVVCPPPHRNVKQPVDKVASRLEIPVSHTPPGLSFKMQGWEPPAATFDLGIVVSFGHYVPESVRKAFPLGVINMHPSLLPRYRGAAPLQHTLLNGDNISGVTILDVDSKIDNGGIIKQVQTQVGADETFDLLADRLAGIGAHALGSVVDIISQSGKQALSRVSQDMMPLPTVQSSSPRGDVAHARKIRQDDNVADWRAENSISTYNRWRAFSGYLIQPLRTTFRNKNMSLTQLTPLAMTAQAHSRYCRDHPGSIKPGQVVFEEESGVLLVGCADGNTIGCSELQPQGKRRLSARTFAEGQFLKYKRKPGVAPEIFFGQ